MSLLRNIKCLDRQQDNKVKRKKEKLHWHAETNQNRDHLHTEVLKLQQQKQKFEIMTVLDQETLANIISGLQGTMLQMFRIWIESEIMKQRERKKELHWYAETNQNRDHVHIEGLKVQN